MSDQPRWFLALLLAGIGTLWRVYDIYTAGALGEMIAEEAKEYFQAANTLGFWPSLFKPDTIYLAIPLRLLSFLLVRGLGIVALFPAMFKIISIAGQSLCLTVVLTNHFSALGPFSVRLLFCLILLLGPPFELDRSMNTTYACFFPLIYALWAQPEWETRMGKGKHLALLVGIFLAAFSKPAMVALLPLFAFRLATTYRQGNGRTTSLLAAGFLGLSLQALAMKYFSGITQAPIAQADSVNTWWLGLKNSVLAAGFFPLNLLLFSGGIFENIPPHFMLWLSALLGGALFAGWLFSLHHARKNQDRVAESGFLLPLVGIPLSTAMLMMTVFILKKEFRWDVADLIQSDDFFLRFLFRIRHIYVLSVIAAMGTLVLAHYWLRRFQVRPAWRHTVLGVAILVVVGERVTHARFPLFKPLSDYPRWSALYRLTERAAYCIPTIDFPRFFVQRNCVLLQTAKLNPAAPASLGVSDPNVRWLLQGVVLERYGNSPTARRGLSLIVTAADGSERTILPFSSDVVKFQYFDLNGIELPRASLRLHVDGKPVAGSPVAAIHYLGSRL